MQKHGCVSEATEAGAGMLCYVTVLLLLQSALKEVLLYSVNVHITHFTVPNLARLCARKTKKI